MELNLEKNYSQEQKMYCIYKHVFPNGKVYIGQTCQKPERRWKNGEGYVESVLLYNAIKKYGWESVSHEILYTNLSQDEANYLEKKLIGDVYKSNLRENGYNIDDGGSGSNSTKGTHWYNNGIIEKRFKFPPSEEWKLGQLPSNRKNRCKVRIVNGKEYESLKMVMQELNVSKNKARLLCGMRTLKDNRIKIVINGIEYESIQEAHRKTGISLRQINKMRGKYKTKGYNYDRITVQCKPITINNVKYKSRARAMKELKLTKYQINCLIDKYGDIINIDLDTLSRAKSVLI